MPLKVKPIITLLLPKWRACHKSNHRLNEGYPISEWKWVGFRTMLLHFWTYIIHSETQKHLQWPVSQPRHNWYLSLQGGKLHNSNEELNNEVVKKNGLVNLPSHYHVPYYWILIFRDTCFIIPGRILNWKHSCLDFWFIFCCKHSRLCCDPIGKVGRLNTHCDIVNVSFFPLIWLKKNLVTVFPYIPLISSRMPWWSNDWLACGIGSKVFSYRADLWGIPFSVNKSKKPLEPQPLETVITPGDTSSFL